MNRVFLAKTAIFFEFQPVGVVLLVLHIVVVALFALGTSKSNTRSHCVISSVYSQKHHLVSGAL